MYKQKLFSIAYLFLYIEINQLGYGLGASPNQGGGNVRVLLAPYLAASRELSGAAKASLRLGLGHPLISSLGLQPPSSPISSSLFPMEAIAYLITILSSSIDSLCDSCSACLLPIIHSGNMPHTYIHPDIL
jgi:hypothetical protein